MLDIHIVRQVGWYCSINYRYADTTSDMLISHSNQQSSTSINDWCSESAELVSYSICQEAPMTCNPNASEHSWFRSTLINTAQIFLKTHLYHHLCHLSYLQSHWYQSRVDEPPLLLPQQVSKLTWLNQWMRKDSYQCWRIKRMTCDSVDRAIC